MEMVFLEIVFDAAQLSRAGGDRDEIEIVLDKALTEAGLGAITGGGTGSHASIIEVEVFDSQKLDQAIQLLRRTLAGANAPAGTLIKRTQPEGVLCQVG